jgi:uncharacterized damage-inducible protein DinB
MELKTVGKTILSQLFDLTGQLSDAEYTSDLELLSGNTVGKHVRHVIEFFELLIEGSSKGIVNYDKRKHQPLYENNRIASLERLKDLILKLEEMAFNKDIMLEVSYSDSDENFFSIKSSLERELAYNIEHAIHHMAIIKIAVRTVFPTVSLEENFGVAYSTVRFQKSTSN